MVTVGAMAVALSVPAATATASSAGAGGWGGYGPLNCSDNSHGLCTEVHESDQAFGYYVGHDEPTVLFYSHTPGSGNQMAYQGILPKEPKVTNVPGQRTYDFELYPRSGSG